MKIRSLSEKITKIKRLLSISEKSIIIAEINHYCIINDFISDFDDILVCDVSKYENYIDTIRCTNMSNIILKGFWEKYHDLEKISSEINYARDIYDNMNKNIVLILPTCVVEYIMYYALSIWSCVTLHEVFDVSVEAPFGFLWLCRKEPTPFREKKVNSFVKEENIFCDKLNCKKYNECNCFESLKLTDFSKCEFLNKNDLEQQMCLSRLLDLGDYFLEKDEFNTACEFYKYVLEKSLDNNWDFYVSIVYLCLAKLYYIKKDFDKSITYYSFAFMNEKSLTTKHKIYNDFAVVLYEYDNSKKSVYEYLKRSEKFFIDNNEFDLLAVVQYNIAIYYYKEGNCNCAMDYVNKLLSIEGLSERTMIQALILKSYLLISVGDFSYVLRSIVKSLREFSDIVFFDYNELNFEMFFLEAYYYFSIGKMGTSLKYLDKSLVLLKKFNTREERYFFPLYYLRLLDYVFWGLSEKVSREIKVLKDDNKSFLSVNNRNKCIKLLYENR